jgi:hypothetical protein
VSDFSAGPRHLGTAAWGKTLVDELSQLGVAGAFDEVAAPRGGGRRTRASPMQRPFDATDPPATVVHMPNIALELGKQSTHFGVSAAYGEQQDVDGVRIVPVALVWAGYGGGSDEQGNGGGGGGGYTLPLGAYIRRGDDLRFDPNLVSLLAVGIPFVWVAGRALSRVIRALKK